MYKKVLGQTITFKNYVGLIQLKKNVQIQILPKIAFLKEEKDETKKVFLKMLRSMKDFSGKTAANANLNPENMIIYSRSPKACEKRNKIIISQSRRKS